MTQIGALDDGRRCEECLSVVRCILLASFRKGIVGLGGFAAITMQSTEGIMYQLEVVNPVSPQRGEVSAFPYAPRPSSLKDKVIGLMWNGKAHGDDALRRAGELIKAAEPSVDVRFYSGALPFPDPLRAKAISEIDVAIGCTAD